MSKFTPGPWEIDWYICTVAGKEIWRTPRAIGPIAPDHNHWAGWNLGVEEPDARLIAAAPEMYGLIQQYLKTADNPLGMTALADLDAQARALLARINGDA